MFHDFGLVFAVICGARIERAVHCEQIGRGVQDKRIWRRGFQVDGVVVNDFDIGEQGKDAFEIVAFLDAVKGPIKIGGGHRVPTMEGHAFAQVEPHSGVVNLFPAFSQSAFELKILSPANQRVEHHMRQL